MVLFIYTALCTVCWVFVQLPLRVLMVQERTNLSALHSLVNPVTREHRHLFSGKTCNKSTWSALLFIGDLYRRLYLTL
jgi:hypothetical protein